MSELQDLEAVTIWDGDQTTCHWCGDEAARVCIEGEAVCRSCHTVAYERASIRDRNRWQRIALAAEELAEAVGAWDAAVDNDEGGADEAERMTAALARFRAATEGEG